MNNNYTTFWTFLKDNPVEIPIIQRDYAQGREGKEFLRCSFLNNIKQALDGGSQLKLDFVYGSIENGRFNPLDGQQRLTTLWLLHWYIALKALKDDEKDGEYKHAQQILCKFGYETRLTSRDFCHELCKPENFKDYSNGSVVDYILNQTWFFNSWKQDPTIQAMLRMIKGTTVLDKNGNDFQDGLEELFEGAEKEQFIKYWNALVSRDAPIVFYHLPLHEFGLSDDLYIKMNARGKQLTSFENFKADLIGYIEQRVKENEKENNEEWKRFLDAEDGIPIKMDTDWTEIFWERRSRGTGKQVKSNRIDEIYFAFINRFFWNELFIAKKDSESTEYILKIGKGNDTDSKENQNRSYAYLNDSKNKNSQDSKIAYESFEPYKYYRPDENQSGIIPCSFFKKLYSVLSNYHKFSEAHKDMDSILRCPWNQSFCFIPRYKDRDGFNVEIDDNKGEKILEVTTLDQIERIVFFAVCKYFSEYEHECVTDDKSLKSLKRWMRVVWNLVSGEDETGRPEIRSADAIRTAIEFIDSLKSQDVYSSLKERADVKGNTAFDKRCREEIEKARKISYEPAWEEKIRDAENYSFCKGAIRFLFRDETGNMDWNCFCEKSRHLKSFFKMTYEKKDESVLASEYDGAGLLKKLFSWFSPDNFQDVLYWNHHTFNNYPYSWKYYLMNEEISGPVHRLLMGEDGIQLEDSAEPGKHRLWQLSQTSLLDYVIEKIPKSWIRPYHCGHCAIYPSSTGIFLDADKRDYFLFHTNGVSIIEKEHIVGEKEYLFGSDIHFTFEGKNYLWYRNDCIYLMEQEDHKKRMVKNREA